MSHDEDESRLGSAAIKVNELQARRVKGEQKIISEMRIKLSDSEKQSPLFIIVRENDNDLLSAAALADFAKEF